MRESFPSPISPWLIAVVVLVTSLTVFAWVWAVRRPAPVNGAPSASPTSTTTAMPSSTPTEQPPLTYAAIGASDVVGMGAQNPATQSWVNLLHNRMPPGTRFVRLGRNGITLREASQVELPQAIAAQPDLVTLWSCVNDATQGITITSYLADLDTALTRLTKETPARVVLLNMPDLTVLMSGVPDEQRQLIRGGIMQWNQGMATTAAKYGERVTILDLFPISEEVLSHPEYISPDNFHPSTIGYGRLADVVWATIQREGLLDR